MDDLNFEDEIVEEEIKHIVVVGRSKNGKEFASSISEVLTDNFSIVGIHSLGEKSDLDKKERYIAFVNGENFGTMNSDFICSKLLSLGFGARSFDTAGESFEYAKITYNFGEEEEEKQLAFNELKNEMKKKFPLFTAEEQRNYMIFDSLYKLDRVFPIRARFDDEPVIAIIAISHGYEDVIVTPVAIIVDSNIEGKIELPIIPS